MKIADLPFVAAPLGTETVVILKDGVAKRTTMSALIAPSTLDINADLALGVNSKIAAVAVNAVAVAAVGNDLLLGNASLLAQAPATLAAIAGAAVVVTSYANPGGQGVRTSGIFDSVRAAGFFGTFTAGSTVDGDNTADAAHSIYATGANTSARFWEVRFPRGQRIVMDEWAIRHATAHAAGGNGNYEIVARNRFEEAGWTQLWTGAVNPPATSGSGDAAILQKIALTAAYAKGRRKGFDTYAIRGVSGNSTATDNFRLVEFEFKLGYAWDHNVVNAPLAGSFDQVLTKASGEAGDFVWAHKDRDPQGSAGRRVAQLLQDNRMAERRSRARYFIDPANGADANGGDSSGTAKATITGMIASATLTKASFTKTAGYTNVYEISVDKAAILATYPRGSEIALAYFASTTSLVPFWHTKVGSLAELDAAAGPAMFIAPAETGARVQKVYVHAVSNGNPASDTFTYRATLAPPKSAFIALRAALLYTTASLEVPNGFTWLGSYGEGALPFIDCGRNLVPGDWTLSAESAVGGGSNANVYEVAVAMEAQRRYLNDARFTLYEIDGLGRVWPAEQAASLAAVANRPGSVWFGDPATPATQARSAASARMFYRPRFSTDPRSDGKTYKVAARKAGVSTIANDNGPEGAVHDGQEIEGIKSGFQLDGQGAILSNFDATVRRCLSVWGPKHAFISKSGRWEHCVAFGGFRGDPATMDHFAFTFYAQDAQAIDAVAEGCGVVFPNHYPCGSSAIYSHGSNANLPPNATLRRFFTYNAGALLPIARGATLYEDCLIRENEGYRGVYATLAVLQADTAASDGDMALIVADPTVANRSWYRWNGGLITPAWEKAEGPQSFIQLPLPTAALPNRTGYVSRALVKSSAPSLVLLPAAGAVASRTAPMIVRNSVLHHLRGLGSGAAISLGVAVKPVIENNFIVTNQDGKGAAVLNEATVGSAFRYNIVYDLHSASDQPVWLSYAAATGTQSGVNIAQDYNVYCLPKGGTRTFTIAGTSYVVGTQAQFAAYQAALLARGLNIDQNSVLLLAEDCRQLFVGDPELGDYRLRAGTLYRVDGTPLAFTDGQQVNALAGPREHLHWNSGAVLAGAPGALPVPPKTEAACELYCRAPHRYDWYAGASEIPLELALAA